MPSQPDEPSRPSQPSPGPAQRPLDGFHAVIPAGGAGTRLWPLSRAGRPKFLLDLTGSGRTLLQATVDRLAPLTGTGNVLVVTGVRHAEAVADQLTEVGASNVLAEPAPRDSMAAIGLAAAVLLERHGDDVVLGSFAADHVIAGAEAFQRAVREAVVAARAGYVVTIGIAATGPSTAFGYVRAGAALGLAEAPSVRLASGFTEKPDAETATAYLATGEYRWNAGMFVVRARVLLDHLRAQLPALHDGLRDIAAAWDSSARDAVLERVWPGLTRIAIDHAIAEPVAAAAGVAVVPGDFDWDDVGDFASLAGLVPAAGAGSAGPDEAAGLTLGAARGSAVGDADGPTLGDAAAVVRAGSPEAFVVTAGGRTVSVVGVPDAVVVDTPDAVLVTTRAHAQDVKAAVDAWRARGREDLL